MSSLEAAFFAVASTASGLGARLYPDNAPQTPTAPYAVYTVISKDYGDDLQASGTLQTAHISVDVHALKSLDAMAIADDMRSKLKAATTLASITLDSNTDYDSVTKLYLYTIDFSIHWRVQ